MHHFWLNKRIVSVLHVLLYLTQDLRLRNITFDRFMDIYDHCHTTITVSLHMS